MSTSLNLCGRPGSLCPWDSPGKNARVGCHALLQGILLTQESNLGLLLGSPAWIPHCCQALYVNHRYDGVFHQLEIRHWVFLTMKRKSILSSMVFMVLAISCMSLHGLHLGRHILPRVSWKTHLTVPNNTAFSPIILEISSLKQYS